MAVSFRDLSSSVAEKESSVTILPHVKRLKGFMCIILRAGSTNRLTINRAARRLRRIPKSAKRLAVMLVKRNLTSRIVEISCH